MELLNSTKLALENAGWDDESTAKYGMDLTRTELFDKINEIKSMNEVSIEYVDSSVLDNINKATDILANFGVVKIGNLFNDTITQDMFHSSKTALEIANSIEWGNDRSTVELVHDSGIDLITYHSSGRFDISPASIPYLNTLPKCCPDFIQKILQKRMGSCGWENNSTGFLPLLSNSSNGQWHRDIRPMFKWDESGSTIKSDELDCTILPEFYFTLFVYLNDIEPEGGETEFLIGSHKKGLNNIESFSIARSSSAKAGDALLFSGKVLHRGLANTNEISRHVLYIVYAAKWYKDC